MNSPTRWPRWLIASLLTTYAVVLAAVMWTETDTGTLEVQLNGAPVAVAVQQGDKELSVFRRITGTRVTLYSGEYRLGLRDPELERASVNAVATLLLQNQPIAAANCSTYFLTIPPAGRYRLDKESFRMERGTTVVVTVTPVP